MADRRTVAKTAAERGASVALESFGTDLTHTEKSGKVDVVTEADTAAQEAVIEAIREHYPDETIVGEEDDAPKTIPETGPAWVVDPIDGTANFVHGFTNWGTAVAAVRDGRPVVSAFVMPALSETYVADDTDARLNGDPITVSDRTDPDGFVVSPTLRFTDRREEYAALLETILRHFDQFNRIGSAQATLALLARGSFDAAVGLGVADPWDTVAGVHLIRQADGTVTDLAGEQWRHDSDGLVASNGAAHDAVLDRVVADGVVPGSD
jgi:myo-inositol-1(or 4)-monophosphatase